MVSGEFHHPDVPYPLFIILDACHMLKLARNTLSDMAILKDSAGDIKWDNVKQLYETQKSDILSLGNKLKSQHIYWQSQKMKVAIAAQTLSHSVAAAISFLESIETPNFINTESTTNFILHINNLFDVLNSRNKFGKQYKTPITAENYERVKEYVDEASDYLMSLTDAHGKLLSTGPRKTFVIGFITSAKSILAISKRLLSQGNMTYVLTYRFSQDLLEMFFSKIRGRLGWNNNPNVQQFRYAIRSLLLKNHIEASSSANCTASDFISNPAPTPPNMHEETPDDEGRAIDFRLAAMLTTSTEWRKDVLQYISGYIARQMMKKLKCSECASALYQASKTTASEHSYSHHSSLISMKAYGALLTPSPSLLRVITETDKLVREALLRWTTVDKETSLRITTDVLQKVGRSVFSSLHSHSCDNHAVGALEVDHITGLVQAACSLYMKVFMYQFSRVHTERIVKSSRPSTRQRLTKSVLFYHD